MEERCSPVPLCSHLIDRSLVTNLSLLIPMNGLDRFSSGLIPHEEGEQMGKGGYLNRIEVLSAREEGGAECREITNHVCYWCGKAQLTAGFWRCWSSPSMKRELVPPSPLACYSVAGAHWHPKAEVLSTALHSWSLYLCPRMTGGRTFVSIEGRIIPSIAGQGLLLPTPILPVVKTRSPMLISVLSYCIQF